MILPRILTPLTVLLSLDILFTSTLFAAGNNRNIHAASPYSSKAETRKRLQDNQWRLRIEDQRNANFTFQPTGIDTSTWLGCTLTLMLLMANVTPAIAEVSARTISQPPLPMGPDISLPDDPFLDSSTLTCPVYPVQAAVHVSAPPIPVSFSPTVTLITEAVSSYNLLFQTDTSSLSIRQKRKSIPELSKAEFSSLYKDITRINGGSSNTIFTATLQDRRPGLPTESLLALRVNGISEDKNWRWFPHFLEASARMSQLRERSITDYIPPIHGIFEMPYVPELDCYHTKPEGFIRVTEMDFIDTDYEHYFERDKNPSTPRIVIEEILGKWAVYCVAGLNINDEDGDVLRHYMLKKDDRHLVYHIGARQYMFPPGYSPRQVDYDDFAVFSSGPYTTKEFEKRGILSSLTYHETRVKDDSIKRFLRDVPEKGLLQSIYDNLQEFEISPHNPVSRTKTIHRYISEEDLLS